MCFYPGFLFRVEKKIKPLKYLFDSDVLRIRSLGVAKVGSVETATCRYEIVVES